MKKLVAALVLALGLAGAYAAGVSAQSNNARFTPLWFNDIAGMRIWVVRDDYIARHALTAVPPGDANNNSCFYVVQTSGGVSIQPTPDGLCY